MQIWLTGRKQEAAQGGSEERDAKIAMPRYNSEGSRALKKQNLQKLDDSRKIKVNENSQWERCVVSGEVVLTFYKRKEVKILVITIYYSNIMNSYIFCCISVSQSCKSISHRQRFSSHLYFWPHSSSHVIKAFRTFIVQMLYLPRTAAIVVMVIVVMVLVD